MLDQVMALSHFLSFQGAAFFGSPGLQLCTIRSFACVPTRQTFLYLPPPPPLVHLHAEADFSCLQRNLSFILFRLYARTFTPCTLR
jgi:hypothetical protein